MKHIMKTVSLRDLHIRTSEIVRDAEAGTVVIVERRGQAVAELRPLDRNQRRAELPDMTRYWTKFPKVKGDSGRFLEEDR